MPNYVYRWYRRNPSFVLFYNIHSLWSGKFSTLIDRLYKTHWSFICYETKSPGFWKTRLSAYLFYVATLKLFICFTNNDNTKDTKTYYFFLFLYKLVWLIHITYPLWSRNLFINMTFHIVIVTQLIHILLEIIFKKTPQNIICNRTCS